MRDQRQKRRSNESLGATAAAYSLAFIMLVRAAYAASGEELLLYKAPNTNNLSQAAISDIGAEQLGISPPFVVQEIATPFSLPALALVSRVNWAGFYYKPPGPLPAQIKFQVRFFANLAGIPAATPLYDTSVIARLSPDVIVDAQQTYSFTANLTVPMLIQPNTRYWLSVVENDPATSRAFSWFESSEFWGDNQEASRFNDNGVWSTGGIGPAYNFSLSGVRFPVGITNLPPTVSCPADATLECGTPAEVTVMVSDVDGDPLTLVWSVNGSTVQTNTVSVSSPPSPAAVSFLAASPPGTNVVAVTVSDPSGNMASCSTAITVVDTTPPVIHSVKATPNLLWPPNHRMVPVSVTVDAVDNCDPSPVAHITGVTSNEPQNPFAPDWEITGPLSVNLRAERLGSKGGRIYTIAVECEDASGNVAYASVDVVVPHDHR